MDLGLARVSSLDQDHTIQLHDLEQAGCWPIYEEKVSGVAAKRPIRDEALAQLRRGDTLSVWKLDRLGRSMVEVVSIVQGLEDRGIRFRVITQPIDTSSAAGRLQLQLLAAFAEFERQMIRERTLAGRARRAREGLHPGGPALYGFGPDHVQILDQEAALVRYVAEYAALGAPMNQIVDVVNWKGHRTRKGHLWTVKTWRRILANPYVVPILGPDLFRDLARYPASGPPGGGPDERDPDVFTMWASSVPGPHTPAGREQAEGVRVSQGRGRGEVHGMAGA